MKTIEKTCAFFTFGCKVNQYETQIIREAFFKEGFIETRENPAYYVVNGCSVTLNADRKCRLLLRSLRKKNPHAKIIVTGCYAQNRFDSAQLRKEADYVVSQDKKISIPEIISREEANLTLSVSNPGKDSRDFSINDFTGHSRAFVKIQDGCDNFCAYCIVPLLRGSSLSKSEQAVLAEVRQLAEKGFREIVLTGINLGAWGADFRPRRNLAGLIERIDNILPESTRLRLSSIELPCLGDELIDVLSCAKRVCPHLHIPLQSGDDEILKKMNRFYSAGEFRDKSEMFRKKISGVSFTTDIIVGFPGEKEGHFQNTLNLIKDTGFLRVHVFPFSRREKTKAFLMPEQVDAGIKAKRKYCAEAAAKEISFLQRMKLLHNKVNVLFEEKADGWWRGYSDSYVQIKVRSEAVLDGSISAVKIVEVTPEETIGKIYV